MHLPSDTHGAVNARFVAGDPLSGRRATLVTPEILNALVYEVANVITAAGIELVQGQEDQLAHALVVLLRRAMGVGVAVCLDEVDGGELDEASPDSTRPLCLDVTVDAALSLADLRSELEQYDDIDSGEI